MADHGRRGELNAKKAELRRRVLRALAEQPGEDRAWASERIVKTITELPAWARAQTVLCYKALPGEVNTDSLIEDALAGGKRVGLPRVVDSDLVFAELSPSLTRRRSSERPTWSLAPGAFGILEPAPEQPTLELGAGQSPALIVVPGVAFTPNGARLGRGRGFYDRYLQALDTRGIRYTTVAPAHALQIQERIPAGPADHGVDLVVTESGLLERRG